MSLDARKYASCHRSCPWRLSRGYCAHGRVPPKPMAVPLCFRICTPGLLARSCCSHGSDCRAASDGGGASSGLHTLRVRLSLSLSLSLSHARARTHQHTHTRAPVPRWIVSYKQVCQLCARAVGLEKSRYLVDLSTGFEQQDPAGTEKDREGDRAT